MKKTVPWFAVSLVLAIVVMLVAVFAYKAHANASSPAHEATVTCERAVLAQLKSPATAHFGGASASPEADSWIVTGYVDSQNGFGAVLRSNWTCPTTYTGGTWTLGQVDVTAP